MKSLGICLWFATVGALVGCLASQATGDEGATTRAKSAGRMCRCADDNPAATDKILQRLSEPLNSTGLDFADEPLANVANFLQDEYKIPIQLDLPALEDVGLTAEEKVSIHVTNVSFGAGLRLLLKALQLTYVVQNETLVITTPQEAESELVTCVYDVRDILGHLAHPAKDGGPSTPDYDSLIDVLVSCVAKQSWAEAGRGPAEIRPLPPGLLVIAQTRSVHEEIESLLETIRATLRQPVPGTRVHPAAAAMGRGMEGMEGGMGMGPESTAQPTPADEDVFD